MTVYVDTSREGQHGIGRYTREVVSRLGTPWTDLGRRFRRPLPVDALNPRRLTLRSDDRVYSPGFNAGFSRATQLLTIHDLIHLQVDAEGSALRRAYYEHIVRPAISRAGLVMTVSQYSKDLLEEWLPAKVEVVIATNGVSEAFRPSLAAANPGEYFVFVGNLRPHKNFNILLEVAAIWPDFRLVVVTADQGLAETLARRDLSDRVTIERSVDDDSLATIYARSAGLLMPSTLEGFGLPALEAISSGVPVAYYRDCAPVAEIVGPYGIPVSDPSSPEEWRAAAESLAAMGSVRPTGEWRAKYSWDQTAAIVDSSLARLGSGGTTA